MELIKMIVIINIEFCKLEKGFISFVLGIPLVAWMVALFGGDCAFAAAFGSSILAGLIGGVIAFFVVPILAKSSVKELNYSTDWIFHIFFSFVGSVYCFFVAWPILALIFG